jgi:hypothetical protein
VLASITIFLLFYIGYQLYLQYIQQDYGFTIEALIVSQFEFFTTLTFSSYKIFSATMFTFGFFIFAIISTEIGFFESYNEEVIDPEMEEQSDRLAEAPKSRFGFVSKIRNYTLPIGIVTAIIGCCLMVLPSVFLIDSEPIYVYKPEEGLEYWYVGRYYGLVRGQLLLIGISLLIIGLVLFIRYKRRANISR